MIKKMNKKGDGDPLSLQQVLFKAAEIAVGAFIIIVVITLLISSVRNSHSQQVSRDFASTLQTISAYPYTTYFVYTADLSDGAITIREDNVRVDLKRGSYTAPLRIPREVNVQEKHFYNPSAVPIISHGKEIFFSDENTAQITCETLYTLPFKTTFFIEYDATNQEQQTMLNQLKAGIERIHDIYARANTNHKLNIDDRYRENAQQIKISFEEDASLKLVYDAAKKEHEMFACFARLKFTNKPLSDISFFSTQFKETNTIELRLPNIDRLREYITSEEYTEQRSETNIRTETDLIDVYSRTIYEILLKIVQDK